MKPLWYHLMCPIPVDCRSSTRLRLEWTAGRAPSLFFFTIVTLPYSPTPNSLFLVCREIKSINYNIVYRISITDTIIKYIFIFILNYIWRQKCLKWPRIGSGSSRWSARGAHEGGDACSLGQGSAQGVCDGCVSFLGFPNLWFGLVDISFFGHHLPVDLLTCQIGIYYSYDRHWLWWIVLSLGMLHLFPSCYMPGLLKI
jgi:hypothetical protein